MIIVGSRKNDKVEIIWNDGLPKESQPINGIKYPKNFSFFPHKVIQKHLKKYGRTTIDVSLQEEGVYYFDFSV